VRPSAALAPAVALLLLAGCGGTPALPVAAPTRVGPVAPVVQTPAAPFPCDARSGLALPAGWPAALPLPPGLVVTRTERRSGDRLIAYGRVPGDFHRVVRFFNAHLPAAGLPQRNGQLDPLDAESDFAGTTVRGRWTTGFSPECAGASAVTVLVLPAAAALPGAAPLPAATPSG
jgi:hypothetical protein